MQRKYMLPLLFTFLFFLFGFSWHNGRKDKHKRHFNDAYAEAIVIKGSEQCGYLLQLTNGAILKPSIIPKKYCKPGTKVLINFINPTYIKDSVCNIQRTVALVEIKPFKETPNLQSKY